MVSVAAASLCSCQWAMMESRLADRVDGTSDEFKITGSETLLGGVVEYTASNGKKFYVQRCRVKSERKPGPLFVFGEIDKEHFTWGNKAEAQPLPDVERYVVIGMMTWCSAVLRLRRQSIATRWAKKRCCGARGRTKGKHRETPLYKW